MSNFEANYKLKTNPFRMTPATNPDELVWAGFGEIKSKFENRIRRSARIPNTTLVLNWGEYGSGKTHAARFFNKKNELSRISKELGTSIPYSMIVPLPKGKEPIFSIYISVIDELNIEEIREKFADYTEQVQKFIKELGSNIHIQSVLSAIFNPEVTDIQLLKKYLYGNASTTDFKTLNGYGILRALKEDTDYTKLLAGFFSCLTLNKNKYSCIIIWIDEFEDIAVLNNTNIDKTNNFLREILDNTPNNLLIFLNLTQSALFSVEDLGQYVYESVRSRIKERISFDLPSKEDFKQYLAELLSAYRVGEETNIYFPYSEDVVDNIIKELGDVSLRQFNETLSLLLELADMDDKHPIDNGVYEEYKDEIIWDK